MDPVRGTKRGKREALACLGPLCPPEVRLPDRGWERPSPGTSAALRTLSRRLWGDDCDLTREHGLGADCAPGPRGAVVRVL